MVLSILTKTADPSVAMKCNLNLPSVSKSTSGVCEGSYTKTGVWRSVSIVAPGSARQRLRQVVILGMKTWLPEETRKELAKVESYARGQVRVHHRILDRFRASPPP
jgi:hypothetical protein